MFNMTLAPVDIGLRQRFHRVSDAVLRVAAAMSHRRGRPLTEAVELGVRIPPKGVEPARDPALRLTPCKRFRFFCPS
jgi:hypothetical protein